jgi:hypothetical protein
MKLGREVDLERLGVDLRDGAIAPFQERAQASCELGVAEPQSDPHKSFPLCPAARVAFPHRGTAGATCQYASLRGACRGGPEGVAWISLVRRAAIIALGFVAAAAAAVGVTAAVTRTSDSTGVSRVERLIATGWQSNCDFDFCAINVVPIPYATPAGVDAVDVTATITFDYRTAGADSARVGLELDDGTPPSETIRPRYPLRPAPIRTTTTLTWQEKDVPAAGQEYTIDFSVSPSSAGNGPSVVSGRKLTVVIESWTAGD